MFKFVVGIFHGFLCQTMPAQKKPELHFSYIYINIAIARTRMKASNFFLNSSLFRKNKERSTNYNIRSVHDKDTFLHAVKTSSLARIYSEKSCPFITEQRFEYKDS